MILIQLPRLKVTRTILWRSIQILWAVLYQVNKGLCNRTTLTRAWNLILPIKQLSFGKIFYFSKDLAGSRHSLRLEMRVWDSLREVLSEANFSEAETFFRFHSFRAVQNRLETSIKVKTGALDCLRKKENGKKQQIRRLNFRKFLFLTPLEMTSSGPLHLSNVHWRSKFPPWTPL